LANFDAKLKKIMFIDTHTHLYLEDFEEDRDAMVSRAVDAGVQRMYLPNVDVETISSLKALWESYPEQMYPMMGLHPCSVTANSDADLERIIFELETGTYYAVGEIGLDFYWDKTWIQEQERAFKRQTEWAIVHDLPIVIHSRDAMDRLLEILEDYRGSGVRGVFHCFTGTLPQGMAAIDLGFKLGIGGVVTFKNSTLPQVLPELGLQHLVLETDAPYLAPVPYRGKRNESSYIPVIAHKLAEVLGLPLEEIERVTTKNAMELFHVAN